MIRSVGFVVDVHGIDRLPKSALIKLGGEGKSFTYNEETLQKPDSLLASDRARIRDVIDESKKFKLYLATHAIFDDGWLPKCLHKGIELITAAVGNYVTIGGWDVANGNVQKVRIVQFRLGVFTIFG